MGKKFLAAGQLADALSHYHAAVDLDPNNYLTYFRRATVYLAIGKSKSALPDLEKVLDIKPDFHSVSVHCTIDISDIVNFVGKHDYSFLSYKVTISLQVKVRR